VARIVEFTRTLCENNPNKINQIVQDLHNNKEEVCCYRCHRDFKVNQFLPNNKCGVCLECGKLLCILCMSAHAPCFGFLGEKALRDPARQARGRG